LEDPAGPQQKVIVLLKMVSEYAFCFGDKEISKNEFAVSLVFPTGIFKCLLIV
jgi:hypothetical protein